MVKANHTSAEICADMNDTALAGPRPTAAVLSVALRGCGFVAKLFVEALMRNRERQARRHLESMTNYELHDIGLVRSQIDDAVRRGRRDDDDI